MRARIVITGANSAIGRVVVQHALARPGLNVTAAVRSGRAVGEVGELPAERGRVCQVDYARPESLDGAFAGAEAVIHLPGILIETPGRRYQEANVVTARAAVESAREAGVGKFVLVSAWGADTDSPNGFFRSKGEAERLLVESGLNYTILRCPLVLGCTSLGDAALARWARGGWFTLLGGGANLDQPLDARDLAEGALNACRPERARNRVLDFVGPENLTVRELTRRVGALRSSSGRFLPIPVGLACAAARLRDRLSGRGWMTADVIEVLTTEVQGDPEIAARELGVELTPLDRTLRCSLSGGAEG